MANNKNLQKAIKNYLEVLFEYNQQPKVINEGELPPGFTSADVQSPDEYIAQNTINEADTNEKDDTKQLLSPDDPGIETPEKDKFNAMLQAKKEKRRKD